MKPVNDTTHPCPAVMLRVMQATKRPLEFPPSLRGAHADQARALLTALTAQTPADRPSAVDALSHPFLRATPPAPRTPTTGALLGCTVSHTYPVVNVFLAKHQTREGLTAIRD